MQVEPIILYFSYINTAEGGQRPTTNYRPRQPNSCYVFKYYSQEIEGWYFQTVNEDFVASFVLADATERTV